MRPTFLPRLVNPPFEDPALFIPFPFERRAILFDLGNISALSPRDLLKIDLVFVSHTHMDHFTGFERLLRIRLGRDRPLSLFGPPGFLKNVEGKLAGYTWNLVARYQNPFFITASEIHPNRIRTRSYPCGEAFRGGDISELPHDGKCIHRTAGFHIDAAFLDHGIPCLAFALQETFHVNILKERLKEMGLTPGPWLRDFKQALFEGTPSRTPVDIPTDAGTIQRFSLGELSERIARITPGQKIAYVTDAACTPENEARIISLAKDADHLFIEAAFLESDVKLALEKRHFTAFRAGRAAALAHVSRFDIFHFSPRYTGRKEELIREARHAFHAAKQKEGFHA